MTLHSALASTLEISRVMVPPIIIGFFVASIILRSPYFRYLTMPTAQLASVSRLPLECSAALNLFLVNSWAALALLSEVHRKGQITDRELIVAVLVGFIPKGFNGMLIYSLPVALSVLGLYAEHLERYPQQISGGEIQRAVLARIISLEPRFVVADEPTSMLDASVQAQILRLMMRLQEDTGLAYLFISHDLDVLRAVSDRIAYIENGSISSIEKNSDKKRWGRSG